MPDWIRVGIVAKREALSDDLSSALAERFGAIFDYEKQRHFAQVIAVSTLGPGACRLFVEKALSLGQRFDAVIPFAGYAEVFDEGEQRMRYQRLIGRARQVQLMPFDQPSNYAYEAADRWIVDACDLTIFVWDGDERSDIVDVYHYAKRQSKQTILINTKTGEQSYVRSEQDA